MARAPLPLPEPHRLADARRTRHRLEPCARTPRPRRPRTRSTAATGIREAARRARPAPRNRSL
ncbi:MAG: hypothetical protein E6K57_07960 [Nitrospirae bacterium]|nr:MAG: hypothetical protein E6K57_07960 [Nitrospirota bacterium]